MHLLKIIILLFQDAKVIVIVVVVGYGFYLFFIKDLIRIIVEWNESWIGERERDHIRETCGCALCGPFVYGAHYTHEKTMENISLIKDQGNMVKTKKEGRKEICLLITC